MAKEVDASSPDKKNPLCFKLKDLIDNPSPDTELEAYLEWEDGSWGTKVPRLIVKTVSPKILEPSPTTGP